MALVTRQGKGSKLTIQEMDGLSIVKFQGGEFVAKTLTLNELQQNAEGGGSFEVYEVAQTSQLDKYMDFLNTRSLEKGLVIYYHNDTNTVSISSIETALKNIEALNDPLA